MEPRKFLSKRPRLAGSMGVFLLTILGTASLGMTGCSESSPSTTSGASTSTEPLYAIQSLIFGDQGQFSYVSLLPSFEVRGKVLLETAREFPGYSPADTFEGKIYVGSGDQPTLTRFSVTDGGAWSQEETLSFSQYTSSPLEASIYVTSHKALVPYDGTNHVTWDPESFTLGEEVGAPSQIPLTRGELSVYRGYGHAIRENLLFQPYYWADESFHEYTEVSQVSVLDTESDKVEQVIDVPCPHLHIVTQDDAGNIYFSNGQGSIAAAVLNPEHPRNCFARIDAGETTLDSASVVYFKDLTDGREGSNLFYIGDGIGFFNVYHAERDNLTDTTEFAAVDYSANYHLWTLDLNSMEATMMEGIDFAGGQFVAFRIDQRTFVTIPAPDYSSTEVYEVFSDGRAEKRFDVEGWAFKMFRVR